MITTSLFSSWKKTMPCSSLSAILMAVNQLLTTSSTACAGKGGWKPMTDIDLSPEFIAHLKTLAQEATPGPWIDYEGSIYQENEGCFWIADVGRTIEDRQEERAYIAAAHPGVLLAMCEEIERLRAEVARLEKEADWLAREVSSWEHDQLDGTGKHIREVPELREAAREAVEEA